MIVLCTDFGLSGPYVGQVKAVLARSAPAVPGIDLFADLPAFAPRLAAYVIAGYAQAFDPRHDRELRSAAFGCASARFGIMVARPGTIGRRLREQGS